MEEKKEKQGERERQGEHDNRAGRGKCREGQFRGKKEAFDGAFTGSVDSLLFCQTSERGPRPVPPRGRERKAENLPLRSLFSVPSRRRRTRRRERESGASTRRQRERTSRAEFLLGRLLLREPGSGNRLLACQLDIYTTVSPG